MSDVVLSKKECSKCGETKPLSEFYKQAGSPDGHQYQCSVCIKEYQAERKRKFVAQHGIEAWRARQRKAQRRYREGYAEQGIETGEKLANRAYNRALMALKDLHRESFEALIARERSKLGLDPRPRS